MRTTTRRIVTLATCGAAFALPVIAGGTAQAAETSRKPLYNKNGVSLTIYGNDNGAAGKLANSGGTTTTGYGYGADSGQAKTILISKLGASEAYDYTESEGGTTWFDKGTQARGTVLALTKVGTTTIVSKYDAVAGCAQWGSTYESDGQLRALKTPGRIGELPSTSYSSSEITAGCYLQSTNGTYVAKGGAVAGGLPKQGSTALQSYSFNTTRTENGEVLDSYNNVNASCQTFNAGHYCSGRSDES